jgi:methenyltetrahydromethanopterin cyclohydrolase
MESLNRTALELVDEALDFAGELQIGARELDCDATVLDFGVDHPGGIEAGLLLAELQTAGYASVSSATGRVAGAPRTHVELSTDHPAVALLGAQRAGWRLSVDGFEGRGSGPARALVADEMLFREIGYVDAADFATLAVEADTLPGDAVAERVAERSGVEPSSLFLPTYPNASLAGGVAGAARTAELATARLAALGYDPTDVLSVQARAPVPPVADAEAAAVARTAAAVAYGGEAHLTVASPFDRFDEAASTEGGEDALRDARGTADPGEDAAGVLAPASVTVDVVGGETVHAGERREDRLVESFAI